MIVKFGDKLQSGLTGKNRGEFEVWIAGSKWRLESGGQIIAGSGQDDLAPGSLDVLIGDQIQNVRVDLPVGDVIFFWASGKVLRVFNDFQSDDIISFFFPDQVYSIESTGLISVEERKLNPTPSSS